MVAKSLRIVVAILALARDRRGAPIIVPIIIVVFVIYGLFSGWSYQRTGNPLVAGLASAIAFAWAIAVPSR